MKKLVDLEEYSKAKSRREGSFKKWGVTLLFLLPFLLAFIAFFVYPLCYGIYISFCNFQYGKPGLATFNDFQWYKILFDANFKNGAFSPVYRSFWSAFSHTIIFAIIMVPVAIILPLTLAILVNQKPPGYKLFRALIYMPSIVPLTAAGSIFTLLFLPASQHGMIAEFFGIDVQWFIDTWIEFELFGNTVKVVYAWIPIFLMCLWGGWGGNFIIMNAGLQNVPKSLYEASEIDGCSTWSKIMNVTLPGIKPQLVLCLFTTIIGYLGLYGQNYVLCGGGPMIPELQAQPAGGQTSTLIYFIQDIVANKENFKATLYGLGAAASIIFAIIVGIISGIQMFVTRDKKSGKKISEAYGKWNQIR